MTLKYDIRDIYRGFFGYVGAPYPQGEIALRDVNETAAALQDALYSRQTYLGDYYYLPVQLNGVWLPLEPLMRIEMRKNIVSTPVSGRSGTVKELISNDDYRISLRGVAVSDDGAYPADLVEQMHGLFLLDTAITINSRLTDLLGIDAVVVEAFNMGEANGNMQPYEFELISDDDFLTSLDINDLQDVQA